MPLTRSEQMARIKGTNTKPEKLLRRELWKRGLRYRLDTKVPIGRPDLVFPKHRMVVFIDGCFWHGCPVHYVRPRSRHEFWADKLCVNVERDRRHTLLLESQGWRVIRLWEHEITDELEIAVAKIEESIQNRHVCHPEAWRVQRVEVLDPARDSERRYLVDLRDPGLTRIMDGPRIGRSGKPGRPGVSVRSPNVDPHRDPC